jgi:hypothetical protein
MKAYLLSAKKRLRKKQYTRYYGINFFLEVLKIIRELSGSLTDKLLGT